MTKIDFANAYSECANDTLPGTDVTRLGGREMCTRYSMVLTVEYKSRGNYMFSTLETVFCIVSYSSFLK